MINQSNGFLMAVPMSSVLIRINKNTISVDTTIIILPVFILPVCSFTYPCAIIEAPRIESAKRAEQKNLNIPSTAAKAKTIRLGARSNSIALKIALHFLDINSVGNSPNSVTEYLLNLMA